MMCFSTCSAFGELQLTRSHCRRAEGCVVGKRQRSEAAVACGGAPWAFKRFKVDGGDPDALSAAAASAKAWVEGDD